MIVRPSPEQEAIVAHPLEPLRVVAGAGTGKTTTIALRLAGAVDGGLDPERALGLTFTNKAAEELADRLRTGLPQLAAAGREVEVLTYHAFAWSLLVERGAHVGVERTATIIGPGAQRQLLAELLRDTTARHLDLTAPGIRLSEALLLARRLADHLRTPEDLLAAAPEEPDEVWARRLELAELLRRYEEAKRRLGLLDHGDLVRRAVRLVSEHPDVADRIRRRYGLVLLDEYQDTDPGQRRLLQLLFAGVPVTAVGDPDQAIYEWRGASPTNFAAFPRHFPLPDGSPAPTLRLGLNRRSGPAILAVANAVQGRIGGRDHVPLRPAPDAPTASTTAAWFATAAEEAAWIARRLHDLRADGIPWREMAVLTRRNRELAELGTALVAHGVPVHDVGAADLLRRPAVAPVHAWLRLLADPTDTPALVAVLLGDRWRLGLADLLPLAHHGRHPSGEDRRLDLLDVVEHLDEVAGLRPDARKRLDEFRTLYRRLLARSQDAALEDLVVDVVEALDLWTEIGALDETAARSARLDLHRFVELAASWTPLVGRPSLPGFLAHLEALDEGADPELDAVAPSPEDAVALLTVHRAKGLEWDVVVLPSLVDGVFPARPRRHDDPAGDPTALPADLRLDPRPLPEDPRERLAVLRRAHADGEWRLAYVAVTRARRFLLATGSAWHADRRRPAKPSELFEVVAEHETDPGPRTAEAGPRPSPRPWHDVLPAPDPLFPDGWRAALGDLLEGRRPLEGVDETSLAAARADFLALLAGLDDDVPAPDPPPTVRVGGLVLLASCPLRYRWAEVERLPRRPGPWLRAGIDFHRRIELHHRTGLAPDDPETATYDLVAEGPHLADPFRAFLASRFARHRPVHLEASFELPLAGVHLRGRIDAIYEHDDGWEIVDFKSGRRRRPEPWLQLEAYALAVASGAVDPRPPEELTITFAWFGGGEVEEASRRLGPDELAALRGRIERLLSAAADGPFEAAPGEGCRDCDFVAFCPEGRAFLTAADRRRRRGRG